MKNHTEHFLHPFFVPESLAVVGATSNTGRINHNLVANLVNLGFQGRVYPVNPREKEILGLKAYPTVKDIEETVDLAVICVPQSATLSVLEDCVKKGIQRVTIVAGGFSEIGEEGRALQNKMARLLKENGIRAIGPNALSPVNAHTNFCIGFFPVKEMRSGRLSLVFQSGLYDARFDWVTTDLNLPLNKLIDLGNKMDINEVDALSYLAMDPGTKVIAIHLESIEGDGRRFLDLIREASSRGKRVVILRSGRTDAGAKAAASHTGALVRQNHALFDAAVRQYGGIRANGIEEFFDVARAMERFHDLSLKGNRILVGTVSGGEGVIVTDLCGQAGLELPRLEPRTLERLKKELVLPWQIGTNPWDLGVSIQFNGPDKVFTQLMAAVAQDSNVDALALQLPPVASRFPKTFFSAFQPVIEAGKPVALWLAGSEPGRHEVLSWAEEMGVAIFPSPERAIRVLRALHLLTR